LDESSDLRSITRPKEAIRVAAQVAQNYAAQPKTGEKEVKLT
jgi:hypothetical protein